jgi:hypothetical protein
MWKPSTHTFVTLLVAVNVVLFLWLFRIRSDDRIYDAAVRFPVPEGYMSDGRFVAASAAPCYLLRVATERCLYCRLDKGRFAVLAGEALKAGCRSVTVAPRADGGAGVDSLELVDLALGRVLNPVITPQTMVVDGTGRILREQDGAMDEHAMNQFIKTLWSAKK